MDKIFRDIRDLLLRSNRDHNDIPYHIQPWSVAVVQGLAIHYIFSASWNISVNSRLSLHLPVGDPIQKSDLRNHDEETADYLHDLVYLLAT